MADLIDIQAAVLLEKLTIFDEEIILEMKLIEL